MKNQKALLILFIALLIVFIAVNARSCHAQTLGKRCTPIEKIQRNFYLTVGFRWDEVQELSADPCVPPPPPKHKDPAFVGAMLNYPVSPKLLLGGNFDRDWTDAPKWNARIYLGLKPF